MVDLALENFPKMDRNAPFNNSAARYHSTTGGICSTQPIQQPNHIFATEAPSVADGPEEPTTLQQYNVRWSRQW